LNIEVLQWLTGLFYIRCNPDSHNSMLRILFFYVCCIFPLLTFAQVPKWVADIGSAKGRAIANIVKLAPNGNVIIAGHYYDTIDLDPSVNKTAFTSVNRSQDMFLACYSNTGNFIWGFSLGQGDIDDILALAIDKLGNVFIGGIFRDTVDFNPLPSATANLYSRDSFALGKNFGGDGFLAKYSPAGAYQWAFTIGGIFDCEGVTSLATDTSGNIFVGGQFKDTCDFDPSPGVAMLNGYVNGVGFIAKYSGSGAYQWAWNFGKSGMDATDSYIKDIAIDAQGDIYLAGFLQAGSVSDFDPSPNNTVNITSNGGYDALLAKYTSSGSFVFAQNIGGPDNEIFNGICLDSVGDIYVTGYTEDSTIDFDPTTGLAQNTLSQANVENITVAKYSNSGEYVWGKLVGGGGSDIGSDICFSGCNIYCIGSFGDVIDLNPGGTAAVIKNKGSDDIYWAAYDLSGNYISSFTVGSGQSDKGTGMTSWDSDFYITGGFSGTGIDFDPNLSKLIKSSNGYSDAYVVRYELDCNFRINSINLTCCDKAYMLGSQAITESGTYTNTHKTAQGYDSIVNLNIVFRQGAVADYTFSPSIAKNEPVEFTNRSSSASHYYWDFGDNTNSTELNPSHTYQKSGLYKVCLTAIDVDSCVSVKCADVTADINCIIGVPTGFSPNGDGTNDMLYVRGIGVAEFVFRVYNRFGQVIFETTSFDRGWDGTYKNASQDMDVVAYTLNASFLDGTSYQKSGNITIIR
jgi:gliding motility-associated-like protein